MGDEKTCRKTRGIVEVRIVCEPECNYAERLQLGKLTYESQEYWRLVKQQLEAWVSDHLAFIQEHRERLVPSLHVEVAEADLCDLCGNRWETDEDCDADNTVVCAHCGTAVG